MWRARHSGKTKGNLPISQTLDSLDGAPDLAFAASTLKLLELEYGYAKDNAVLAISQRSAIMQIYMAAIGLVVTVILATVKDLDSFFRNTFVVCVVGLFGVVFSIYTMRGLVFLRSDWCDYVNSMAKAKLFLIRMEVGSLRNEVLEDGLYHDPFHPPSRNLKTNFFYISYVFCSIVLFLSASMLSLSTFLSAWRTASFVVRIQHNDLIFVVSAMVISAISIVFAGITWSRVLRTKRTAMDLSPRAR